MGDKDDGLNDTEVEFVTMYQGGHSDGYNHYYGGPLYESQEAADCASKQEHGMFSIGSKTLSCIRLLRSGRVYVVEGPYKTHKDIEMEDQIRGAALAKLSELERKVLGLK